MTWRLLRPIDTAVGDPHNELSGARALTVPYDMEVQVLVNHDFSETFYREKFDGDFVGKSGLFSNC